MNELTLEIIKYIESCLEKYEYIIHYNTDRKSDGEPPKTSTDKIIWDANREFKNMKIAFLNANKNNLEIINAIIVELYRIELQFDDYQFKDEKTFEIWDTEGTWTKMSSEEISYSYKEIQSDLSEGKFSCFDRDNLIDPSSTFIISMTLSTCKYHQWLISLKSELINNKEKLKLEPISNREETIEFRNLWMDPDKDIPYILKALEDLDFIDSNQKWIFGTKYYNPAGVIKALIFDGPKGKQFLRDSQIDPIVREFAKRFEFPKNKVKRYECKGGAYETARSLMKTYMNNHMPI